MGISVASRRRFPGGMSAGSGLVLVTGSRVVALGLAAGALLAVAGLRLLQSGVVGIEQRGAGPFVAAALVLGATSLVAMWRPAALAAKIDPNTRVGQRLAAERAAMPATT